MRRKLMILAGAIICLLLALPAYFAFADNDFLTSEKGETAIKADEELDFKIDLTSFNKGDNAPYKIQITVSPLEPALGIDLQEDIDVTYNKKNGTYVVHSEDFAGASEDGQDLQELNFTARPDTDIEEITEYTVTAKVSGGEDFAEAEESISFTVEPVEDEPATEPSGESEPTDPTEVTEPTEVTDPTEVTEPTASSESTSDTTDAATSAGSTAAKETKESASTAGTSEKETTKADKEKADKDPGMPADQGGDSAEPEYKGSSDNYLKSLTITGHEMTQKFHKTRDTYFVDLDKTTESLDVHAAAEDRTARVDIAGNRNVSSNMSKIVINVTAQNGDLRVYRIYVRYK